MVVTAVSISQLFYSGTTWGRVTDFALVWIPASDSHETGRSSGFNARLFARLNFTPAPLLSLLGL